VTGDGLFNLVRTARPVGFDIEHWPEPPPIFALLQRLGEIPDAEMYRAFNMGIGFALVVAPEGADAVRRRLEAAGETVHVLGTATEDPQRTIRLRSHGLVGRGGHFTRG
jgi:phosphoribosylformylglycinamidine cyclo-ligase